MADDDDATVMAKVSDALAQVMEVARRGAVVNKSLLDALAPLEAALHAQASGPPSETASWVLLPTQPPRVRVVPSHQSTVPPG